MTGLKQLRDELARVSNSKYSDSTFTTLDEFLINKANREAFLKNAIKKIETAPLPGICMIEQDKIWEEYLKYVDSLYPELSLADAPALETDDQTIEEALQELYNSSSYHYSVNINYDDDDGVQDRVQDGVQDTAQPNKALIIKDDDDDEIKFEVFLHEFKGVL